MRRRIVLIEDDVTLAYALERILKRGGYNADVFVNSLHAWERLKGERPSLLIVDLCLPKPQPNGVAVAAHATMHHAGLPVIYMSGHADLAASISREPNSAMLLKPVAEESLLRQVAELLV